MLNKQLFKRIVSIIFIVFASICIIRLIVGSSYIKEYGYAPKPFDYPNSKWLSEDGTMTISIGEQIYNNDGVPLNQAANGTLNYCNTTYEFNAFWRNTARIECRSSDYDSDENYTSIVLDSWSIVECNDEYFIARISRSDDERMPYYNNFKWWELYKSIKFNRLM